MRACLPPSLRQYHDLSATRSTSNFASSSRSIVQSVPVVTLRLSLLAASMGSLYAASRRARNSPTRALFSAMIFGQGLPERRLSSCLPYTELQPLQSLAGNGIIGQRCRSVLQIEGP
jgi:hypothetical protein